MTQEAHQQPGTGADDKGKHSVKAAYITAIASIIVGLLGLVGGIVVAMIGRGQGSTSPQPAPPPDPPIVKIRNVDWDTKVPNRYVVSGTTERLQGDQLLWAFNQRSSPTPTGITPETGPCAVDVETSQFSCKAGYAGDGTKDDGEVFTIWVAAVTRDQAATLAEKKATGVSIGNPDDIPHFQNAPTAIDHYETTHPRN